MQTLHVGKSTSSILHWLKSRCANYAHQQNTKDLFSIKTLKYSAIILGFLAAAVIGVYFFIKEDLTNTKDLTEIAEEINERDAQEKVGDPASEVELDMTEYQIQTYIHQMTHQHVEADKKWGGIDTTPENIKNLLVIVQANQDAYEYGYYYIEVLEQWEARDFSNAMDVHNTIWSWHGGTVGRATGLIKGK